MARIKGLKCKECGELYPLGPIHVCEYCFGPLEVDYNYAEIKNLISREKIAGGPSSIWRYRDLLPVERGEDDSVKVGFTPLQRADNLARALGLRELYVKNDSVNPTYSFKDRVVAVALAKAKEFGFDTIACASTGNLASAVAAAGAKAGLKTYVFLPADVEKSKIVNAAIYGATLVAVDGTYDELNRLCSEVADRFHWAFFNINIRPYYAEGSKTLAFEVVEQLQWQAPDHVVVPIASGSLLTKVAKGLRELQQVGLIANYQTRISGAQAAGCGPVAEAFATGAEIIHPVRKPQTIAKSLAIGNPADGLYALEIVRQSGGSIEGVTEEEIIEGIKLLARTEGIFTETAGGVTIGALKRLVEKGKIAPDERTIAYITGNGLKTPEAVVDHIAAPLLVKPTVESFDEIVGKQALAV
ncbi:MAG: threonine synthase [Chloroflexi bacterium]|nr:threonine synthase [Chloroflexota bacterium]MCL5076287.1 threonine synthase [Chloroflexota bacterium]